MVKNLYVFLNSTVGHYCYILTKKVLLLIAGIALFFFPFFLSSEKMIIFTFTFNVVTLLMSIFGRHVQQNQLIKALIIVAIIYVSYNLYKTVKIEKYGPVRIEAIDEYGIENLGPIKARSLSASAVAGSPIVLLFGLGPLNYGNEATATSQQFYDMFVSGEGIAGAFVDWTNTRSALLAEYGLIGFSLFFLMLLAVVKPIWNFRPSRTEDKLSKRMFSYLILAVLFIGFVNPHSDGGEAMWTFPMMFLAAYLHNSAKKTDNGILASRGV